MRVSLVVHRCTVCRGTMSLAEPAPCPTGDGGEMALIVLGPEEDDPYPRKDDET